MSDKLEAFEFDVSKMRQEIKAEIKEEIKAEELAEQERINAENEKISNAVKAALTEAEKEHQEELKKLDLKKGGPAYNTRVGRNSKTDEATDEFMHWMKTGDNGMERVLRRDEATGYQEVGQKALQVGADTEGGYLAPEGFYNQIVAQRDQLSWVRNSGVRVIQTSLKNVQVPRVDTKMSVFGFTAEEAAYSDSDPIFGEVDITVYKSTRLNKFSEELLQDEEVNLERFYAEELGRAWARTESQYVCTGTGSSQPVGIFSTSGGGTAALTFDSTGNITADEIPELFYLLGNGYRQGSVWLMNEDTEGYLRKVRDANNWAFDAFNNISNTGVMGTWKYETFYGGRPIYTETSISTIGTGNDVICIGNMEFYGLVEHSALSVSRNPYLYQGNGQVGFFAKVRWGGAVLQAGAFQVGTMA